MGSPQPDAVRVTLVNPLDGTLISDLTTSPGDATTTSLLIDATSTGAGSNVTMPSGMTSRVYAAKVVGTGAVSATVEIWGVAGEGIEVLLGTITLSGTTSDSDGFASDAPWPEVYASVTAISGTGAAVTVTMGS